MWCRNDGGKSERLKIHHIKGLTCTISGYRVCVALLLNEEVKERLVLVLVD